MRGVKLIGVFLILNVMRDYLVPILRSDDPVGALPNLKEFWIIFVTGENGSKAFAFYILIPIAYLLILTGILMLRFRSHKYTFHFVSCLLFVWMGILSLIGMQSSNLELLAVGMLGAVSGCIPIIRIEEAIRHPFAIGVAYGVYIIAITIWDVQYLLQIVGVCLSLMLLGWVGSNSGKFEIFDIGVNLLGRYSLFAYIAQIAILQVGAASLRHVSLGWLGLLATLFTAFAFTRISVEIVHRARARVKSIDRLYKAVFA